ncbi:MAG: glycosyltransferase, partial [Vulcanimicrobiaceae bacterium]
KAKGRYVYVCSANTILRESSLAALVAALERDPSAAVAVSQVRSPDGRIADAGRLLRDDGSWHVYGQGENPRDSRFRYVRSIGAPAAASVLWRSGDFGVDGLSEAYAGPLALEYALADAAVEAATAGHKTLYQPASVVTLRDPANQSALVRQASLEAAARAVGHTEAILVVDDHVPFTDRDAGSERMAGLLELMTARAHVILGTAKHRAYGLYGERLRQAGVELITGLDDEAIARLADWQLPVKTIWLSRADVAARYLLTMRRNFPNARILYDTVDLHFVRLQRQQAVTSAPTDWARLEGTELALARASDGTIVTSGVERALLRERGVQSVHIVSMAAAARPARATAEGSGMIFFGNYAHLPNVDGALWLAQEILPRVRRRLPGIGLTIAGADPTPEIWRWHLDGVAVTGYVPDLDALIARHRVAALPLRFGAGVKGKVLRAMACGMPVVTTPIGLEGITERDERFAVGSTAEELAEEIVRAYSDLERWNELSHLSQTVAARFSERALAEQLDAALNVAER